MHYAGENFILIYILPTHEKLKTHFGFSQAKCIKKVQAKVAKKAIWSMGDRRYPVQNFHLWSTSIVPFFYLALGFFHFIPLPVETITCNFSVATFITVEAHLFSLIAKKEVSINRVA